VEVNIVNEVAALQRLTIGQLRQRFAEVFGEATPASNRTWLVKRIAWRLQALAEGDLSERARRRAEELARDADLRLNAPCPKISTLPEPKAVAVPTPAAVDARLPPPGTILTRPYKGQQLQVQVLTDGFAYAGRRDSPCRNDLLGAGTLRAAGPYAADLTSWPTARTR
jgi:hypothetical protein